MDKFILDGSNEEAEKRLDEIIKQLETENKDNNEQFKFTEKSQADGVYKKN